MSAVKRRARGPDWQQESAERIKKLAKRSGIEPGEMCELVLEVGIMVLSARYRLARLSDRPGKATLRLVRP